MTCFFVIYASNFANERRDIWREMELILGSVAGSNNPWVIDGDFNVALIEEEHSETRFDRNTICGFQNVVFMCDMVDLAQVGPTWTNCQEDNSISKRGYGE